MSLLISLRSERLKTKRTAAFYLTFIAAIFAPLMSSLDAIFGAGISPSERDIIFNKMMTDKFEMTGLLMLPLFAVLISTLLSQIEYKNSAWKQVFASPQTKVNVFFAKYLNMHLLIVFFLVINMIAMFLVVVVLHFRKPSVNVLSQPIDIMDIVMVRVNAYVAILAMCSIQFWLGLRFKNFIVPIAIGVSCWIVGTISVFEYKSSYAAYFPFSFHVYGTFPKYKDQMNTIYLTSLIYTIIVLVLAFINFKNRGTKS